MKISEEFISVNADWPSCILAGKFGGSLVKDLPANAADMGSISGLGRSPGEGNGNSLQYSCLKNSMDRGACRLQSMGLQKSCTRLSD